MAAKGTPKTKRMRQPVGKSKQTSMDELYDKSGEVNGEKTPKQEEQAVKHYKTYIQLTPGADDADKVKQIISDWEKAHPPKKARKRKKKR